MTTAGAFVFQQISRNRNQPSTRHSTRVLRATAGTRRGRCFAFLFNLTAAVCGLFLSSLAALFLSAALPITLAGSSPDTFSVSPDNLLQFKADGHLVGFQPNKVYLATADHALSVEFVGATGVRPYASSLSEGLPQVTYREVWVGISITYQATHGGIAKSAYLVAPGADVARIRLRYNVPVELQSDGSLQFRLSSRRGWLTESAPVAWQAIAGKRVPVSVTFSVSTDNVVGFRVSAYDPRYALTIDPTYQWHTFYGSSGDDFGNGIAADAAGNVYIAGTSQATWQGDGNANPKHAHSGRTDIVVVKLDSGGTYQWHAFYGSSADDFGNGIAVDGGGNVYVTGYAYASWQGAGSANPKHAYSGDADIVVVKLDSNGAYQWHTFYGSSGDDRGNGIAVDSNGNAYATGYSTAAWQGDGNANPQHGYSGGADIVAIKLDSNGVYQWHTFYGGTSENDFGYGVALDGIGNAYVVGYSRATWQGDGNTNPKHPHSGNADIVVVKLNRGGAYQWHTFYGSSGDDFGYGSAVDSIANVYVTGYSTATWQGDGGTNPKHAYSGGLDSVMLKLDNSDTYQWHTFYGSNSDDYAHGIAADPRGNVYSTGYSFASWQGDGNASPQHAYTGNIDLTIMGLAEWRRATVNRSGTGNGTVTSTPSGINCGSACSTIFDYSTVVTLTATAVTGSTFAGWSGAGCSGTGNCVVIMDSTKSITATFTLNTYLLTVAKDGTGSGTVSSTPEGIYCGSACSINFDYSTVVTLTATGATGSTFVGWSGAGCNGTGNCILMVDAAKNITATFSIRPLYLPLVTR